MPAAQTPPKQTWTPKAIALAAVVAAVILVFIICFAVFLPPALRPAQPPAAELVTVHASQALESGCR